MLDTKCYKCTDDARTKQNMNGKPVEKVYQGNGIFKCSWCGDILDLSNKTYKTKISRVYNDEGKLETEILETDTKFDTDDTKDYFIQDIYELDIFEDFPFGKYEFDILWYYYNCGGYEFPNEYDVEIKILSEEELE